MSVDFYKFKITPILEKHGYTLKGLIGAGAYGQCYIVFSKKYNEKFCCKCMRSIEGKEDVTSRQFNAEVTMLSHMSHKNIVKIYDYFTEKDFMFMIIEYCELGSLSRFIEKSRKFVSEYGRSKIDWERIRKIVFDILSALLFCHEGRSVSHHDIKPGNIVIDAFGQAKLCDFGLSHLIEFQKIPKNERDGNGDKESAKKNVSGSLIYMSPQILNCGNIFEGKYNMFAADIWAFGVTVYALCVMKYPFSGRTRKEVFRSQFSSLSKPNGAAESGSNILDAMPSDIPNDLRNIIKACLTIDEQSRASARQLLSMLSVSAPRAPVIRSKTLFQPCTLLQKQNARSKMSLLPTAKQTTGLPHLPRIIRRNTQVKNIC